MEYAKYVKHFQCSSYCIDADYKDAKIFALVKLIRGMGCSRENVYEVLFVKIGVKMKRNNILYNIFDKIEDNL